MESWPAYVKMLQRVNRTAIASRLEVGTGVSPCNENIFMESWQNGYCTSLENWRAQALGGSNPSLSAGSIIKLLFGVLFT